MAKFAKAAWAIRTGGERDRFIGKYYFSDPMFGRNLPAYLKGCPLALFDSRVEARTALSRMKPKGEYQAFPQARIVRVSIAVKIVGRG